MVKNLTENKIMQVLDWAYDKAVNGVPGVDSAQKMAEDYSSGDGTLRSKVNSLIRWQISKAGISPFIFKYSYQVFFFTSNSSFDKGCSLTNVNPNCPDPSNLLEPIN